MITLQQNLQRPFYIKHLLERLRYGKAAVAMRREAADLIEKMNEDSSNLSAQNSYQAMRIEELQRDLAAAQEALKNHLHLDNHNAIVRQLEERALAAEERAERAEAAITRARRVMGGEGVADQAEAWDQCLRILDAAIAAGEGK